jgi:hypothetical protein
MPAVQADDAMDAVVDDESRLCKGRWTMMEVLLYGQTLLCSALLDANLPTIKKRMADL